MTTKSILSEIEKTIDSDWTKINNVREREPFLEQHWDWNLYRTSREHHWDWNYYISMFMDFVSKYLGNKNPEIKEYLKYLLEHALYGFNIDKIRCGNCGVVFDFYSKYRDNGYRDYFETNAIKPNYSEFHRYQFNCLNCSHMINLNMRGKILSIIRSVEEYGTERKSGVDF